MSYQQEQQVRREGFEAYGGPICACCNENHASTLVLDRIESTGGDEELEDMQVLIKDQIDLCRKLKGLGWPPGYWVLCANCHIGRGRNGGVCPHRTKNTK